MKPLDVLRADAALRGVGIPSGLRKCTSRADAEVSSKELTPEQQSNVDAKELFRKRCREALGEDMSVRDLALFFGVKRSKLHERMRLKRTDLAPLTEWFEKLERYEDFMRAADEFLRTA